jgi:pyruvate formate lyase activating enzyme
MVSSRSICTICGDSGKRVSRALLACADCILEGRPGTEERIAASHGEARRPFDLPIEPPRRARGVRCPLCANECRIGEGERGYCGLRTVRGGKLVHLAGTPQRGLLQWYRDPLPTNCVADWVCEGHRQHGSHNLAVFYCSCTADCLFCQNWHFRRVSVEESEAVRAGELADAANDRTFCVCFFGGDPASQMPHALAAAKMLAERGVRVCWETAGTMHPKLFDAALRYSLDTGGCVKFDLKAFDERLHRALTGISNRRTLENFARAGDRYHERADPPPVVASTLLVPGYVEAEQVSRIARFIASIRPEIPYSLLAFAPNFCMGDLPCTSRRQAEEAEDAARSAGLLEVRVGNRHLLDMN